MTTTAVRTKMPPTLPNRPKARIRSIRVPVGDWEDAKALAWDQGVYLITVITQGLQDYVKLSESADPVADDHVVPRRRLISDDDEPAPNRVIRVHDALWDAAMAAAEKMGEPLSEVIRRTLRSYVSGHEGDSFSASLHGQQ